MLQCQADYTFTDACPGTHFSWKNSVNTLKVSTTTKKQQDPLSTLSSVIECNKYQSTSSNIIVCRKYQWATTKYFKKKFSVIYFGILTENFRKQTRVIHFIKWLSWAWSKYPRTHFTSQSISKHKTSFYCLNKIHGWHSNHSSDKLFYNFSITLCEFILVHVFHPPYCQLDLEVTIWDCFVNLLRIFKNIFVFSNTLGLQASTSSIESHLKSWIQLNKTVGLCWIRWDRFSLSYVILFGEIMFGICYFCLVRFCISKGHLSYVYMLVTACLTEVMLLVMWDFVHYDCCLSMSILDYVG